MNGTVMETFIRLRAAYPAWSGIITTYVAYMRTKHRNQGRMHEKAPGKLQKTIAWSYAAHVGAENIKDRTEGNRACAAANYDIHTTQHVNSSPPTTAEHP